MALELEAGENINRLLTAAGWHGCGPAQANIHAARGVAIREFPLESGHGFADDLLHADGKAAGVIEARKEGVTLTGVETRSGKYTNFPDGLPRWYTPLPFACQSNGVETRFTNGLDPEPRSRGVPASCRPSMPCVSSNAADLPNVSQELKRIAYLEATFYTALEARGVTLVPVSNALKQEMAVNSPTYLFDCPTAAPGTAARITW